MNVVTAGSEKQLYLVSMVSIIWVVYTIFTSVNKYMIVSLEEKTLWRFGWQMNMFLVFQFGKFKFVPTEMSLL